MFQSTATNENESPQPETEGGSQREERTDESTAAGSQREEGSDEITKGWVWPEGQLNVWITIMLITGGGVAGIFTWFTYIQKLLGVAVLWCMPFWIVTGFVTVLWVVLILVLTGTRRLLPQIVGIGSFILCFPWIAGLIGTSIILWRPGDGIHVNCGKYHQALPVQASNIEMLNWITARGICQQWVAAFALALVGTLFLPWFSLISYRVWKTSQQNEINSRSSQETQDQDHDSI